MCLGVYIHIPFCAHKCPYCDFNSYVTKDDSLITRYVEAAQREVHLASKSAETDGRSVATIFFGGGTPSLIPSEQLGRIIGQCHTSFDVVTDAEVTLEANPGTVCQERLEALRQAGFNRISIGAQSFQPHILQRLGRIHTAEETVFSVRAARDAGFENVSLDLISSVPGGSVDDWQRDLELAVSLEPDHISAYSLTFEAGTEFGELYRTGRIRPVDEETDAEMFGLVHDSLTAAGYEHYEISNYARPGKQCRHNLIYWHNENWIGIGAGAHTHFNGMRRWNVKSPSEYADMIAMLGNATESSEDLGRETQMGETMMLGLRLVKGVSIETFHRRFGMLPQEKFGEQIVSLKQRRLLQERRDHLLLTRKGVFLANVALMEFV